jgi:hypothetical protein
MRDNLLTESHYSDYHADDTVHQKMGNFLRHCQWCFKQVRQNPTPVGAHKFMDLLLTKRCSWFQARRKKYTSLKINEKGGGGGGGGTDKNGVLKLNLTLNILYNEVHTREF